MKKNIIILLLLALGATQARCEDIFSNLVYYARAGYSVGGTAPVGMPATIRSLSKYTLQPNVTLALDAYKPLGGHWGIMAGFHIENKGMKTDARVKNYHMEMRRGGESLEGMFTGQVITDVEEWMITLPFQAAYNVSDKVRLRLGPYLSYVLSNDFSGIAYGGYLRVGSPVGNKVEIGTGSGSQGTYDFSDDLRRLQFGVDFGADWEFSQTWGVYFDLSWGLTGIFKSDFNTIEQTLYPIYGTIGLTYKFK
ncbi:MAG: porin family protein [Prevotellaceae bacterium]|nr:porin family protein [Prevotellaceae bacterium]